MKVIFTFNVILSQRIVCNPEVSQTCGIHYFYHEMFAFTGAPAKDESGQGIMGIVGCNLVQARLRLLKMFFNQSGLNKNRLDALWER